MQALAWHDCAASDYVACWQALAMRAAEPNPFFEHWYLLPALQAMDPDSHVQLLIYRSGVELLGLMPVLRRSHYYGKPLPHLAAWTHPNSFLGTPLIAQGHEQAFWRAALAWVDRAGGMALFMHLPDMVQSGPVWQALNEVAGEQSRPSAPVFLTERAALASTLSPEDYLAASLTGKKRKELRRQMNRLSELGEVGFTLQSCDQGLDEWTAQFLTLEAKGWKGQAGSALANDPRTLQMFTQALMGAAAAGKLDRLSLTLDRQPIAMLASFITPPGAFSYKTAFDEEFARFSPGVQIQIERLRLGQPAEIKWTDSCAAADHPMIDHIWRERRSLAHLSIGIGGRLRQALFRPILWLETARIPKEQKA